MDLVQAVQAKLKIAVATSNDRHQRSGWYWQGQAPVSCSHCSVSYHVFRCPYSTDRGNFKYWALVCANCLIVVSLDDLREDERKLLRKWDKTPISNQTEGQQHASTRLPMKKPFRPTEEQERIVEAAKDDYDIAVNALAGTGKTTTLKMVAQNLRNRKSHYIAFNRAIVDEARRVFPSDVNCLTAHSLAFRAIGHEYKGRLQNSRPSNRDLASYFGASQFAFQTDHERLELEPDQVAGFAVRTVWRFCKSLDSEISGSHVPIVTAMKGSLAQREEFENNVVKVAEKMWSDLLQHQGIMKFEHDHYLKMWQLGKPTIPGDLILFDEAQDADPVMLDVVNSQEQSQLIYCGDSYQSIYEWRGAKDALQLVAVDKLLWLTQSFRFGEPIAAEANTYLNRLGSPVEIKGFAEIRSELASVARPRAILCRTNFGAFQNLRHEQSLGRRTALLGSVKDGLKQFARGSLQLIQGQRSGHPELAVFRSWQEALDWANSQDDDPSDTSMLIRLVERVGAGNILRTLDDVVTEEAAEVVVSTAHRAKGREWSSVRLAADFKHPADMDAEDLRLTYVAVTRAQHQLDLSHLPSNPGEKPELFSGSIASDTNSPRTRKRPPVGRRIEPQREADVGIVARLRGKYGKPGER